MDLENLTIKEIHQHLKSGDFSVKDLVSSFVKRIEEQNSSINAFLEVYDDWQEQAEKAQELFKQNEASLLTGIPLALKDNILIKGRIVSAGSKMLENYRATFDSTVVSKLKKEGVVFLGRTNMDEFAMGSSTENSAFGVTHNPADLERVPGGSSGGSAAAVTMGGAVVALGSETNGSVRQPASLCGCVGLKPTYGRVSRHGLVALGSSLDQIGPLTKTVGDAEIVFDYIKGEDPMDSTSVNFSEKKDIPKKIVLGIPQDLLSMDGIDKEVKKNFQESVDKLSEQGYEIKDISLPHAHYSLAAYYVIMPAEVSSNLARYDGVRFGLHKDGENLIDDYIKTRTAGFGAEARRRIILGTYVLSSGYYDSFYGKANAVRKLVISDFEKVFDGAEKVHAIITPSTPSTAFKIGEKVSDPLSMYMSDILASPSSIAGFPGISLPSGFSEEGLPIGFQIVAPYFREDILFKIGKDFLGEVE